MQYILTQEELDALHNRIDSAKQENRMIMQALCTQICDLKPIKFWDNEDARPWECIHSLKDDEWYCDECPVKDMCPETHKQWSK